jgi:hypothetical protein
VVNPKYPPRKGDHNISTRSPGFKTSQLDKAKNKVPYHGSSGGNRKPPSDSGCKKLVAGFIGFSITASVLYGYGLWQTITYVL